MFDQEQIRSLAAVLNEGSFDAAAKALNVTPPAISQRIRALEERVGTALLIRSQPVQATETGQLLFRHAETIAVLEQDLNRKVSPDTHTNGPMSRVRIAVNTDSLDTWFVPVLTLARESAPDLLFDVVTDDQDHSAEWLKRGQVLGAVTAEGQAMVGCVCTALGSLRYVATASPEFAENHFQHGVTTEALANAPALTFDRKDSLQKSWASRECSRLARFPTHILPSSLGFVAATEAGLGWGMNPEKLVEEQIRTGKLVPIGEDPVLSIPLYWHVSRITANALLPLTRAMVTTARDSLLQK